MDSMVYDLNSHLTYRLARLQAQLNAQASGILKTHAQISLSEWRVLAVLSNPDVKTQKDMMRAMSLDKGQISRTVKRLEAKQLVEQNAPAHDHRQRHVTLSEHGKALVKRIFPIMMKRQAHLQSEFTDEALDTLFSLLGKLEQKTGPISDLSLIKNLKD